MSNAQTLIIEERRIRSLSKRGKIKPKPLIKINGYNVLFQGTINIIQGKAGTHKSRFAEHLASSLINPRSKKLSRNGFKAQRKTNVIYIDTERSESYNLPDSINRIRRISSKFRISSVFRLTSLLKLKKKDRISSMVGYIDSIVKKSLSANYVIIIDVLTDLIKDFNNPTESMSLIDTLNRIVKKYSCTLLCVIHENPSTESRKARGHLGTELQNKATNVFRLSTAGNEIKVETIKSRNTALPPSFKYSYSEKQEMFLRLMEDSGYSFNVTQQFTMHDFITYIGNKLTNKLSRQEFLDDLKVRYGRSEKFLDGKLKSLEKSKTQIKLISGTPYYLASKRSSKLYYYLSQ